jgi:opacity protein-like surface antigen
VLTFVGNFMIAPKLGPVQPYGLIGAGLMRTSIESGATTEDENQISWDVGGGIMVFFSQHVGVRGDIRYFHSFQALENLNFLPLPIGKDKIDFGRAAIAVVFKF